jgi:hypothetical protein
MSKNENPKILLKNFYLLYILSLFELKESPYIYRVVLISWGNPIKYLLHIFENLKKHIIYYFLNNILKN